MRIEFDKLKDEFKRVMLGAGLDSDKAEIVSNILAENDLDGIHTHGSIRFPSFAEDLKSGKMNINNSIKKVSSFSAYEVWDGQGGLGIVNGKLAMDRAMELADEYGIGLVAVRNTNHWMRGGSYAWQAADKGYASIAWTNCFPNMPAWGGSENKLGNSPIVFGVPRDNGEHLVVDMALTQFSYGKLQEYDLKGEELPVVGGFNKKGEMTRNPSEIIESKQLLPTGYWKGTSLSLVIDMMGVILSAGNSVSKIGEVEGNFNITQVFIAISPDKNMEMEEVNRLINEALEDFKSSKLLDDNREVRYPGERVIRARKENLEKGIPIHEEIWDKIRSL